MARSKHSLSGMSVALTLCLHLPSMTTSLILLLFVCCIKKYECLKQSDLSILSCTPFILEQLAVTVFTLLWTCSYTGDCREGKIPKLLRLTRKKIPGWIAQHDKCSKWLVLFHHVFQNFISFISLCISTFTFFLKYFHLIYLFRGKLKHRKVIHSLSLHQCA